jgi:hypothetical protein
VSDLPGIGAQTVSVPCLPDPNILLPVGDDSAKWMLRGWQSSEFSKVSCRVLPQIRRWPRPALGKISCRETGSASRPLTRARTTIIKFAW